MLTVALNYFYEVENKQKAFKFDILSKENYILFKNDLYFLDS